MKTYTATNNMTNETFTFKSCDGNQAKRKAEKKFGLVDVTINEEESGEEFRLVDDWLSESAYVSRDMCSNMTYIFWVYDKNQCEFLPIISMTDHRLMERTDDGFYWNDKSTHKCGKWFVSFPKSDVDGFKYAFIDYCEKHGNITFEELS